jgi:hypothetical protein
MKTAIYISEGITQLVLTPESDWEKSIISQVSQGEQQAHIYRGSFYECQGGWVRHGYSDDSLILRTPINPDKAQETE